MQYFVLKNLIL